MKNKNNTLSGVGVEGALAAIGRQRLRSEVLPSALCWGEGCRACRRKLFTSFFRQLGCSLWATVALHQLLPPLDDCHELLIAVVVQMPQWRLAGFVPQLSHLLEVEVCPDQVLVAKEVSEDSVLISRQVVSQAGGNGGELFVEVVAKVRFVAHDCSFDRSNTSVKLDILYNYLSDIARYRYTV